MNFRTTYILLGVVGVALLTLLLVLAFKGSKGTDSPKIDGYLIQSLRAADVKASDVETIEIEKSGSNPEKIVLVRDKSGWNLTAPVRGKADSTIINNLVNDLFEAKTEKNAEIGSMAQHGLENPGVKITLKAKSLSATLSLGNITIGGDSSLVYIYSPDLNRKKGIVACTKKNFKLLIKPNAPDKATTFVEICKGLNDFRPLGLMGDYPDPLSVTRSVTIKEGDKEIVVERAKDGTWKFIKPKDFGEAEVEAPFDPTAPKESQSTSSLRALLATIQSIRPGDASDFIDARGGLAPFGLDPAKDKFMTVALSRDNGELDIIYLGGDVKDPAVDRVYARPEADNMVAKVNATAVRELKGLLAAPNKLRSRTLAKLATSKIDAVDIEVGGQLVSVRLVGKEYFTYVNGKRRPASPAMFELVEKIISPNLLKGYPQAGQTDERLGMDKPTAVVKVWENGIIPEPIKEAPKVEAKDKKDMKDPPEPPKEAPKVDVNITPKVSPTPTAVFTFGAKEVGNLVIVRRQMGGEKFDAFAPLELATLAERKSLDYVSTSLPQITADSVLKANFLKQGFPVEVERTNAEKPSALSAWKVNEPAFLKDRVGDAPNITDLLTKVSLLTSQRPKIHAEKPTDKPEELLNRLELNPAKPRGRVTVKLKDGTERVILFGGEVGGDSKRIFCTTPDSDFILEVDRDAFEYSQKIDVQDAVVHRLEKAKFKSVKITGWSDVVGNPIPLEFERKDGAWVGKGLNYTIDAAKLDAFLDTLTAPRAESYLVVKTGPRPEDNIDVNKGGLIVVIEGDKTTTVTLSAPDKDGKIRATSSEIAGDVFILKDQFAEVRKKPAYFKKD